MRAYCLILDEETGLVQKGEGCPDKYYIEIGMEIRDIKQSDIDSEWYLTEKCPMKPEPTAEDRRNDFLNSFFKVEGYGYYRRRPKGYQSAIESINTAYNMCKENNGLPAGVLIFYQEPDFNKPEQCTEEWLTTHQIVLPAMNVQTFVELYNLFITTWNRQEH
jgi:hypothetical protein